MGRHGGINILHQKSWHVWRMDNRLRVERDELQHAAQEEERRRAEEQAVFSAKVARMRQRAETGVGDQQRVDGCLNDAPGERVVTSQSASSHSPADQGKRAEDQGAAKNKHKKDAKSNEYKYGAVTLSNLKLAEKDLDRILAKRPPARRPECSREGGGLGSGPHINLFEEAERENSHHASEHEKQLEYTKINNELAGKSARRQMSEFDEIMCMTPWYMRPPKEHEDTDGGAHANPEECQGSARATGRCPRGSRSRSPRRVWSTAHGQATVQVKYHRKRRKCELRDGADGSGDGIVDLEQDRPHGKAVEVVEEPRKRKESRKASGREKKLRERDELHALRLEREARERAERDRASRLSGGAW